MDQELPPVNVTVAGKDPVVVNAVAAVISDSVTQAGFTDVRMASLNRTPEECGHLKSGLSNMDVIRRTHPELLATPVVVEYMHHDPEEPPRDQVVGPVVDKVAEQLQPKWGEAAQGLARHAVADVIREGAGPLLDAHPHETKHPEERDEVIGAEVPLNPAQEEEQELDIQQELTGNIGAVDGDPVAADPEDA